jgi:hypothetical protein
MNENTNIRNEKARTKAQYEEGLQAGYDSLTKPLPVFYATKTLVMLTAYERGYFIGRELAREETEVA